MSGHPIKVITQVHTFFLSESVAINRNIGQRVCCLRQTDILIQHTTNGVTWEQLGNYEDLYLFLYDKPPMIVLASQVGAIGKL